MSWRYAIQLLNDDGMVVAEQSSLSRDGMLEHLNILTQYVGSAFEIVIQPYDPEES